MKRRDFLAMGVTMAGMLAAWPVLAQTGGHKRRAAVVIGVKKAGKLPVLRGVTSGTRSVANWLEAEGFEVRRLVDESKPVRASEIFDVIEEFVGRGTLDQLVIYFSGHGFLNGYSEHWLLSKAPDNPNEAVSLRESVELARESAIPNVVFISDACRSTPDSLGSGRVRGSLIFPNRGVARDVRADVDQFLAALPGDPAFEVALPESVAAYEGIYTACFLGAFERPDDTMVRTVNGMRVVPNNMLKSYLEREVRKKAEAKSIKLRQIPDAYVTSGEATFIGRVMVPAPQPSPVPPDVPTIVDVAGLALKRAGAGVLAAALPRLPEGTIAHTAAEIGFTTAQDAILGAPETRQFETQTGFVVSGARVTRAICNPKMRVQVLTQGDGHTVAALVRVEPAGMAAGSVALGFSDGSGAVVAALDGYIGNVVVGAGGVSNVSYIPSRNNWRWADYEQHRARINELHAAIATTARFGLFRIEGERKSRTARARQLGDTIRILKGIDPTLGLYAAYAYSDADLIDQVESVLGFMRDDLRTDLFDVAMLAGVLSGSRRNDAYGPVPFCPLLSQGWNLVRARGVRMPPEVDAARDYLRPALWTTFDPGGMQILTRALLEGRLR
ncbi:MAG: hypothetical protein AzoDbin1_04616 [Azoarcus sp.]|nr:hypothetical protein [Azoarcus sp.]